jgi:hypothetical protein
MLDNIFPTSAVIGLAVFAIFGFLFGLAIGDRRKRGLMAATPGLSDADASSRARMFSRAVEGAITAVLGAALARFALGYCLEAAHALEPTGTPEAAQKVTKAAFTLLWAGVPILGLIDTIPYLRDSVLFSTPNVVLWIGTAIGGLTGAINGAGRIYPWIGVGALAFILDVTWGIAGSGLGFLWHLVNLSKTYSYDERAAAHRYLPGVTIAGADASTLGSVIGQRSGAPAYAYTHELHHVWHARVFGPFYPITYMLWMIVFFIPAIISAAIKKESIAGGILTYTYLNNPWEALAYQFGGSRATAAGVVRSMLWGGVLLVFWSVVFFGAVGVVSYFIITRVWR